jgi:hypothetical protein
MKPDSLKLVDMIWLDDEITSCRPLRRAWGEEEIFLDRWGLYEQVFGERPEGSISNRDLLQPDEDGTFLLLRSEHVERILKFLYSHVGELSVMSKEQLGTLEEWKSLSLANHRHMVAYIFNRAEVGDATTEAASRSEVNVEIRPDAARDGAKGDGAKRLEVKTGSRQFILVLLLGLFMIPLGALLLIGELSKGSKLAPAMLSVGFAPLITYGVVAWLFRRAYVKSVKYFSDEGLVLNDGRSFAWADLSRVVDRIRLNRITGLKFIWRTEIHFKNGEAAWLLPTKINNFNEVYKLVGSLPCEHAEVRV